MAESKTKTTHDGPAAFTLIEIIVVVVILSIAALIAVPMMSSAADIQVRAAANRMAADLEYAKNMAITHQRPFTVVFDKSTTNTNGYELRDGLNIIKNPITQGDFQVRFAFERSIAHVRIPNTAAAISLDPASADNAITFDYLGTPHTGLTTGTPLNSGIITLRDTTGNFTLTVNVEPMTGYVTITSTTP